MNISLLEDLEQMPRYINFMKELVTKKRMANFKSIGNVHHYSSITTRSLVKKKEDPRVFTISCAIGPFILK